MPSTQYTSASCTRRYERIRAVRVAAALVSSGRRAMSAILSANVLPLQAAPARTGASQRARRQGSRTLSCDLIW